MSLKLKDTTNVVIAISNINLHYKSLQFTHVTVDALRYS